MQSAVSQREIEGAAGALQVDPKRAIQICSGESVAQIGGALFWSENIVVITTHRRMDLYFRKWMRSIARIRLYEIYR